MSRTLKGLYEISPYLYVHMLACHSFMEAGKRHKSTGFGTKDSLLFAAVTVTRVHVFLCWFPETQFPQAMRRIVCNSGVSYRRGIHILRDLNLL